jgi:malate dehydrogenase (oxaloacetate-decarboxylating)(NADP+)
MVQVESQTADAARAALWLVDDGGLLTPARAAGLSPEQRPYVRVSPTAAPVLSAAWVEAVRPTVLIGVSGQHGLFSSPVLRAVAAATSRPIVFALSNPDDHAECDAASAYAATDGRAVFASGGPSPRVGTHHHPAQVNNALAFPGLAAGARAAGVRYVTDAMLLAAARALADRVTDADRAVGRVLPPLEDLPAVTASIAAAVAAAATTSTATPRADRDEL